MKIKIKKTQSVATRVVVELSPDEARFLTHFGCLEIHQCGLGYVNMKHFFITLRKQLFAQEIFHNHG